MASKRKRGGGRRRSSRGGGKSRLTGFRAFLVRWFLRFAVLLLVVGAFGWVRCGWAGCPDLGVLGAYTPSGASVLLDRFGEEVALLHPLEHEVVSLDELPPHLPDAFLAVEDRRFQRHGGVDWIRVAGAAIRNFRAGGRAQGASTLTMQLARSVFPERIDRSQRTFRRKLLEVRVAIAIEHRFEKRQILELYLNHVYLGGGAHGVQAAARYYFDRPATELVPAESALLAALARAPASYDPRRHPERALARRDLVLGLMEDQGRLDATEVAAARAEGVRATLEPPRPASSTPAPYFVHRVRQELDSILGRAGPSGGLRIHTTLDPDAQRAMEEAVSWGLARIERGALGAYSGPPFDPNTAAAPEGTAYLQSAGVVVDVETGDVLALVGGRSHAHSRFDRAVTARRPTGSAFKPFVLVAALQDGFVLSQPLADRPFRLVADGSPDWSPGNYDGEFRGEVSLREALVQSLNVPVVRLGMAVGPAAVAEAARMAGVVSALPETPAAALGTAPLSPLELTAAYATFAGMGQRVRPRFVTRVDDRDGETLYELDVRREPVLDPRIAYLVNDVLRDAVSRGTAGAAAGAGMRGIVAGKTGTTQDGADAWFVGYTPRRVGAVWIGHDRPRSIIPGASGGRLAAPVWARMMARSQPDGEATAAWERPPGLVAVDVDPRSGLVPARRCRGWGSSTLREELFLEEHVPAEGCREAESDRGLVARIASAFRGLFGGRDEEPAVVDDAGRVEPLESAGPRARSDPEWVDRVLGVERVPLAELGAEVGAAPR